MLAILEWSAVTPVRAVVMLSLYIFTVWIVHDIAITHIKHRKGASPWPKH